MSSFSQPQPLADDKDAPSDVSSCDAERNATPGGLEITFDPRRRPQRYIGILEIVSVGWGICNSWIGVAVTLSLVLAQGGSVTTLYGVILIFIMYGCIVFSLAELASVYPSAGGQYHWTSILCPPKYSRAVSYACGVVNIFSWTAILAGILLILAQMVIAIVIFYDASFQPHPWHFFVLYQIFNVIVILHNMFTLRHTMWTFIIAFGVSLASYFIIMITTVARAKVRQSSHFVWAEFINMTGWKSDGVVFLVGLISPNYMYSGIDGAIHLAEECTNAATAVPRALMATWLTSFVTAFSFLIAMMYSIADFDTVLNTPTGFPIYELWAQATQSRTAATVFLLIGLVLGVVALIGATQTTSRLTWAFARDNALLGSSQIGLMHKTLKAPCWALVLNGVIVLIMGCVYLGSSTAFNSIIGTSNILQLISFAFPAALLLIQRRSPKFLPADRGIKLPSVIGWTVNFTTVAFALLTLVFYDFPTFMPVTPSNMNYASVVMAVMALCALLNWFLWARKHYHGPAIDIEILRRTG